MTYGCNKIMTELVAGANVSLNASSLQLRISTQSQQNIQPDFAAYLLAETTSKVRGDADMVFYGQTQNGNASVKLIQQHNPQIFALELSQIEASIGKVAISASLDAPHTFNTIQQLKIEIMTQGQVIAHALITGQGRQENALIIGEFYRRNGQWKFRLVAQGFNGGLKPLSEYFGVEISDAPQSQPAQNHNSNTQNNPSIQQNSSYGNPFQNSSAQGNLNQSQLKQNNPIDLNRSQKNTNTPTNPTQQASPVSKLNLNKITLDKQNNKINLSKSNQGFGEIKVNLNWHQQATTSTNQEGGFFKKLLNQGQNKGIDLDLGCLYEMQDGTKSVVQALGNTFGNFQNFPYIQLSADDRTGAISDGEWLRINGQHWSQIRRVVIFAFIYEGIPNWAATDGVVTIYVPDQPPIEIGLTEGQPYAMCGIVELTNQGGGIQVQRHVRYVQGHRELDQAFGFGLRWKAGSK